MSIPVYSVSSYQTNANQLPINFNQCISTPPPVMPFQQNNDMSFLSFPPPNLPGAHHVYRNGSPNSINAMQPAVFTANPPPVIPSMIPSSPFPTNVPSGNMISPAANTSFSGLASMPPPPVISPLWIPTPMDQMQAQNNNFVNGSLNINNQPQLLLPSNVMPAPLQSTTLSFNGNLQSSTVSFPGNFQLTTPTMDAQSSHPWAPASSNNFPKASETINPWTAVPPPQFGTFNNCQNDIKPHPSTLRNSISPWASSSPSHNFSNNLLCPPMHVKESPSQFMQSNNSASNINPWARPPPMISAGSSANFTLPNGRNNQQNYGANKFNKPNFHHRSKNTRNYTNNSQDKNYTARQKNFRDTGDFSGSKPYNCDTCDRAFYSTDEFQTHIGEHIKCNIRNCQFEAHPKIVALHKKMQHDTGYADSINKLKNADEIEKWRAERRRRFPTAENIAKRKAEQAEREARGEVIENKEFGQFKKPHGPRESKYNRSSNRKRNRNNRNNRMFSASKTEAVLSSDSDDDSHITLPKFPGISAAVTMDAPKSVSEETQNSVETPEETQCTVETPENLISRMESSNNHDIDSCLQNAATEKENLSLSVIEIENTNANVERNASLIDIVDSDDDAPAEITNIEAKAVATDNAVRENVKVNSCSNTIDVDTDDDAPTEVSIIKVNAIVAEKGIKENISRSFGHPIDVDLDNDTPTEIPIYKEESSLNDDESDDAPIEIPVSKVPLTEISNSTSAVVNDLSSVEARKKDTEAKPVKNSLKAESHKRKSYSKNTEPYHIPVRKSSLLEKLLADDIRHERNVVMQCIRHIVKKNFFGIGAD